MDGIKSVDWFWGYIEGYARASKLMLTREEDYETNSIKLKFTDPFADKCVDILISHFDLDRLMDFGLLAYEVLRKVSYEFCMR